MLRAVHLLLALPLFVVIVAVDPRWLRRALEQHHAALFLAGDRGNAEWRASPADYLDKIFQIPYALRPIGERSGGYIRSLLPEAVQQVYGPVVSTPPPAETTTGATAAERPTAPGRSDVNPGTPTEKLNIP